MWLGRAPCPRRPRRGRGRGGPESPGLGSGLWRGPGDQRALPYLGLRGTFARREGGWLQRAWRRAAPRPPSRPSRSASEGQVQAAVSRPLPSPLPSPKRGRQTQAQRSGRETACPPGTRGCGQPPGSGPRCSQGPGGSPSPGLCRTPLPPRHLPTRLWCTPDGLGVGPREGPCVAFESPGPRRVWVPAHSLYFLVSRSRFFLFGQGVQVSAVLQCEITDSRGRRCTLTELCSRRKEAACPEGAPDSGGGRPQAPLPPQSPADTSRGLEGPPVPPGCSCLGFPRAQAENAPSLWGRWRTPWRTHEDRAASALRGSRGGARPGVSRTRVCPGFGGASVAPRRQSLQRGGTEAGGGSSTQSPPHPALSVPGAQPARHRLPLRPPTGGAARTLPAWLQGLRRPPRAGHSHPCPLPLRPTPPRPRRPYGLNRWPSASEESGDQGPGTHPSNAEPHSSPCGPRGGPAHQEPPRSRPPATPVAATAATAAAGGQAGGLGAGPRGPRTPPGVPPLPPKTVGAGLHGAEFSGVTSNVTPCLQPCVALRMQMN